MAAQSKILPTFQPAVLGQGRQDWEDSGGCQGRRHPDLREDGAGQPQRQSHLQHPHRAAAAQVRPRHGNVMCDASKILILNDHENLCLKISIAGV